MVLGNYLKNRIGRKLVIAIVLMSLLLALFATIIQLYSDYKNDIKQVNLFLTQIEHSYLPMLSNSLWDFDTQQIDIILKGILAHPGMEYVEIVSNDKIDTSFGSRSSKHFIEKEYPLIKSVRDRDVELGTLKVSNSIDSIYQQLYRKALTILISKGVETFFVAIFIFFLVHHLVTKRLFTVISHIRNIDFEEEKSNHNSLESSQQNLGKNDEFEEMLEAIHNMQAGLETAFLDLKSSQTRYKRLFERSPVPLWEEDFTDVMRSLKTLNILNRDELRSYFANNPDRLQQFAEQVKIVDINKAALELHGAGSKEELLGNLDKIFTQNSLDVFAEELTALAAQHTEFKSEGEVTTLQGELKTISVSLSLDRLEDDTVLALLATVDITKRIEKERQYEMLVAALEHVAESVIITDASGVITYVNSAFEQISAYSSEEVLGRNPRLLSSGSHETSFYRSMWNTINKGSVWRGQICNKRKNGHLNYEYVSIAPVTNSEGQILNFVAVKRDITEEREKEKHLLQSQKMESIGNLAGGIAHDFNNILSSIIGYSEIALDEIDQNSTAYADIQEVLNAGIRAKDLVQQILLFARQADDELRPVKVEPVITEVVSFLESTLPASITIDVVSSSNSNILGNATQIHQVLMNLCTNAAQAIDNNIGKISIQLEDVTITPGEVPNLKKAKYIKLQVSDNGNGIPNDIKEMIFEPYFSTKGPGEGTGLGLSVVQGIAKNYGGTILVESTVGKGTTFSIYLPAISRQIETSKSTIPDPIVGNERILFVDDEIPIVKMGERILTNLGYIVTTRTSSIEALELFSTKPFEFDLLISDLTMPNMTGDELVIECMKIRPDIPVILCTGYSNKISMEEATALGVRAFAFKPIVKADLAHTIRTVLDQPEQGK